MTEKTKKTASGARKSAKPKAKKGAKGDAAVSGVSASPILLPEGYRPSEDEEFMNPMQLAYFRTVSYTHLTLPTK